MDDILLYGLIAKAKNPKDFEVVGDYLSYDPYGMMYRKGDEDFGVVIRRAIGRLMASGDINKIYNKWFLEKLPSGEMMGVPMSPLLKAAITLQALPGLTARGTEGAGDRPLAFSTPPSPWTGRSFSSRRPPGA